MKKRIEMMIITVMLIIACTGCKEQEGSSSWNDSTNGVEQIINEQIDTESKKGQKTQVQGTKEQDIKEQDIKEQDIKEENIGEQNSEIRVSGNEFSEESRADTETIETTESVDIDLTKMGSDMVYATVYQLMVNPEEYKGKTICMSGSYYATYYEPTKKYYYYCVIQDATACCSQGMEFIWGDGTHTYPDEYPKENTVIKVTGIFEPYSEEGDSNLYCRLKNATLEVTTVPES